MQVQEKESIQQSEQAGVVEAAPKKPAQSTAMTFGIGMGITVLLGIVATVIAPLPGLAIMGSLTVALLLGLAWRSTIGLPRAYTNGVRFSAQKLLRYGIILTGVRLNFALVAASGIKVLVIDSVLILFGLLVIPFLLRKIGISPRLAFLMSVGQSICGASAVGAMAALFSDTDEDDVTLAVAICGLIGTVGVLLFTFSAHIFASSSNWYGLLTGSTLHEIAQVVAAGAAGGAKAADLATIVKLTRVMLLAPVALVVAGIVTLRAEKRQQSQRRLNWKKLPLPWFVFGFLAVGVLNSLGVFPKSVAGLILQASVFLLVVAMAAMGLMVDLVVIRKTGMKALGAALLMFVLFVGMSVLLILVAGSLW